MFETTGLISMLKGAVRVLVGAFDTSESLSNNDITTNVMGSVS